MSTRSRILLALLALTLAPLLGVAIWACVQAVRWSPDGVQLRLARATVEAAIDVRARHAEARESLEALGARIAAAGVTDSAGLAAVLVRAPGARGFARVRVLREGAVIQHTNGQIAAAPCGTGAPILVEAEAGPDRLVAELSPAALLAPDRASGHDAPRIVVVGRDGLTLADPSCVAAAGLLPPGAGAMRSPSAWGITLADAGLAVVGVPGPGWPRPFPEAGLGLLLAAVFCAMAAAGAFVILVRDLWRSMDVLTSAAVRIGHGDFSPWLPPPSSDEVGRLSFAIGTMAARIEEVMQQNVRTRQMAAIGELASHVSHEIRNPLSSIKLNLQSVDREMRDGSVPSDLPAVVQLCLREVNRLDGTVHGVLRLAGVREPELAPCALHAVVEDAVQTVRPQFEANGRAIELRLEAPSDHVLGDVVQLRGVMLNLLLNAHDAMRSGGRLEVRSEVFHDATRGALLRVCFADDGPGIPPEDRDRVFQPFFTTKPSGTGIGLPLAQRTVEAHRGRLYLERRSELEQGAEFVIELPLAPRETASSGPRSGGLTRWRVRPSSPVRPPPRVPETVS